MAEDNGSSVQLFDRVARVLVSLPSGSFSDTDPSQNTLIVGSGDDAGDPGLRIVVKITKTSGKDPNTSEVVIYNLAPTTRAKLQAKGVRLVVEAGYRAAGVQRIFVGDARTIDHVREGPDFKTVIKLGDGERSIRYARASQSFAGGSTVAQVVDHCAKAMGLSLGNVGTQLPALGKVLYNGWTAHGAASTELERILRAVNYSYSVQEGQIQILAPGQSIAQAITQLAPDSGLIGSPEMGSPEKIGKPQALKFRALLLAEARPGGRVHLKSDRYDGIFRLRKVSHSFDTRGGDWYTDMEGIADSTVRVA